MARFFALLTAAAVVVLQAGSGALAMPAIPHYFPMPNQTTTLPPSPTGTATPTGAYFVVPRGVPRQMREVPIDLGRP